jgi:hypothetical protein
VRSRPPEPGVLGLLKCTLTWLVCRDPGIGPPDPRHSLRPRT